MQLKIIAIGKTDNQDLIQLIKEYEKRLQRFAKLQWIIIPDLKNTKNLSQKEQKRKEGELILKELEPSDYVVLMDENGKEFTSRKFSEWIAKKQHLGSRKVSFIIGGPYGFDEAVINQSEFKIALSKMTFSHQMVRLFFVEQIYRAFSILHNLPYHHD
ncbi:23S rRNA (pseudouridine(1915)-N(3))-methyltransferase RlmH [Psychroflexus maritimus]|uniref:Ribosomal RNA large subunit methyltransferase H n=1 Tax=Psychroflexus maritimus TaxID=2714865 RepID=A0A967DZ07_9FLAO|nr:23S rRNA (pseudouridine(1915)-N(3))-methyltransferase RlmH [Psychroflexus maritimus]NGZ88942.1 23S rRNA (pseudouridine(1915)-N(3))-methyltransferase RlmH [Psychroflexus maritimus]